MIFSELTRQQFRSFRAHRRAWLSFWILTVAFLLALGCEHLANKRPLVVAYQSRLHFPTLRFYSDQHFGGAYQTEADYALLAESSAFKEGGGWMIYPPIPHDPFTSDWEAPGAPPHAPSLRHWLGTDSSARDVAARLLYGFRTGMTFALALTTSSLILGFLIGAIQGYLGGKVDLVGQRLIEIWSALPFLYVVILMGSIYGQSFWVLLLVFTLFRWIGISLYVRAEFLKLKNQTFIQAALSQGASHHRLILRHLMPNALSPVVTLLPFGLITAISSLTALDFLGFGMPPPSPSWGELLQQGLENLNAPWLASSSVAALFFTLLLASFVGEGVRAAFDPRQTPSH
ncbi:MAG: ABC transporter permease [Candidatus Methylacidiphilales bacterium]